MLTQGGAPRSLAEPLVEALGEGAARSLDEDPWQLLSFPDVRVGQADAFARALLGADCRPDDPRRSRALLARLWERSAAQGHTALESTDLRAQLGAVGVPDPDRALREAVADGQVLVFQESDAPASAATHAPKDADEEPSARLLLSLDRYALAEESLAEGIVRLISTWEPGQREADWANAAKRAPSPSTADLIKVVAGSGLTVHTGGEAARAEPAALVAISLSLGLRAWAVVFTEDSRRRMGELMVTAGADSSGQVPREGRPEGTGNEERGGVVTITELLSGHPDPGRPDPGRPGPGRQEDGTLDVDILIVCDAPQLDVETAATLVEAIPDGTRLVLSGDPGVLESAGPGRVFADVLAAKVCPHVASRTPDPGAIGELVSSIAFGELVAVEAHKHEVVIVPVTNATQAVRRTGQLMVDSIPRALGIPTGRVQVITVAHGGAAGTRVLNTALKERLNPGPGRFGGFDPGDRVVYTPTRGHVLPGTVVSGEADALHLDCSGNRLVVRPERIARVRHGWAITAHQAAGMRWPAVVVVVPGDELQALTRQWVYTAFGRAERHLSVVHGADQALRHAVTQVSGGGRTTRLQTILREQAPERNY